MGEKSEKRRKEIYTILGLLIGLCGLCGTWLAVPKLQPVLDRWGNKPAEQSPPSTNGESTADTTKTTHTVTILNNADVHLRFENIHGVQSEQMTSFEIEPGLQKIPIEYSYNGETWLLDSSLELNVNDNIVFDCKNRPMLEWSFKSIGISFGLVEKDDASFVECNEKK